MKLAETLEKINQLLSKIASRRPLSQGELEALRKALAVEFTYNSNAIEGSTLTRGETKLVIEDGLTVAGKTIREINETLNHKQLFECLYTAVDQRSRINADLVLQIHKFVLKNIDDENAGKYRKIQVYISGDEKEPPVPEQINQKMQDLFTWFEENNDKLHPAELAAEFHYRFVKIHPFVDGNGRTIRILMNIILMQKEFPLVIIPNVRRAEYISSLNSAAPKAQFLAFFADVVHENLKDYLRMIAPSES